MVVYKFFSGPQNPGFGPPTEERTWGISINGWLETVEKGV